MDQPSSRARGGGPAQSRELRAQGRKTMRKLLDAGMTVLDRRGYHAARVDDIVKVAHTSHGTFYLYFANKEELFRALLQDVADELGGLADSMEQIGPDAAGFARLRGYLGRLIDIYTRHGPALRAWTEAEVANAELARLGDDVLARFTRAFAARVSETGAGNLDAGLAAMAVVAMVERLNYYVYARGMGDPDTVLDTLSHIIHRGLFAGAGLGPAVR